jgi:hypothetical protein
MENENKQGIFHDAVTGETIVRDLTAEEIEELPVHIILPESE